MQRRDDPLFEHARHGGNCDVGNILAVNRNPEQQAAAQEQ